MRACRALAVQHARQLSPASRQVRLERRGVPRRAQLDSTRTRLLSGVRERGGRPTDVPAWLLREVLTPVGFDARVLTPESKAQLGGGLAEC